VLAVSVSTAQHFRIMSIQSIRTACVLTVLVLAAVVLPVTHGLHETVDHDCTLCQLRHTSIGDAVEVLTCVDCHESGQCLQENVVDSFGSCSHLPSGSRAPPA